MLYVVCCSLYAVCCVLYIVCCVLCVVCCVLCVVCCLLCVVCCMLYVVCCVCYVVCCLLHIVCCVLCVVCCVLCVGCCVLCVACGMLCVVYCVLCVVCSVLCVVSYVYISPQSAPWSPMNLTSNNSSVSCSTDVTGTPTSNDTPSMADCCVCMTSTRPEPTGVLQPTDQSRATGQLGGQHYRGGGWDLEGEKIDVDEFGSPTSCQFLLLTIPFNFKDAVCQNVGTGHRLQGGLSACCTQCGCASQR